MCVCVSLSLSLQPFYLPSLYLHSLINIFFKGTLTVYVTKEKNESWIVACHVNKTRQDLFALFIFSFHFIYACVCVCECVRLNVFACVCVCVCVWIDAVDADSLPSDNQSKTGLRFISLQIPPPSFYQSGWGWRLPEQRGGTRDNYLLINFNSPTSLLPTSHLLAPRSDLNLPICHLIGGRFSRDFITRSDSRDWNS